MATADYSPVTDAARHRWLYLGLLVTFAVWGAVDVLPRGGINPQRIQEHRTDFTVYTEAGAAFFDGRDPYQVTNPRGWRYLYPPLFAIVVSPLHALPSTGQVCVWFVLSVAMAFGCYVEMRRSVSLLNRLSLFGEDHARLLPWIGIAALLAVMLPTLNCLQRGQVEVLKLYLLLLGFRLALAGNGVRQWCLAGVVFALASILKLTPLLPVACLILYDGVLGLTGRSRRLAWQRAGSLSAGVGAGLLVFALLLPASILGWNANLRHLGTWFSGVVTKVIDVRTTDFGEDVRTVRNREPGQCRLPFRQLDHRRVCRRSRRYGDRSSPSGDAQTPDGHPSGGRLNCDRPDRQPGALARVCVPRSANRPADRPGGGVRTRVRRHARRVPRGAGLLFRTLSSGSGLHFDVAGSTGTSAHGLSAGGRSRGLRLAALLAADGQRKDRTARSGNDGLVPCDLRRIEQSPVDQAERRCG